MTCLVTGASSGIGEAASVEPSAADLCQPMWPKRQ